MAAAGPAHGIVPRRVGAPAREAPRRELAHPLGVDPQPPPAVPRPSTGHGSAGATVSGQAQDRGRGRGQEAQQGQTWGRGGPVALLSFRQAGDRQEGRATSSQPPRDPPVAESAPRGEPGPGQGPGARPQAEGWGVAARDGAPHPRPQTQGARAVEGVAEGSRQMGPPLVPLGGRGGGRVEGGWGQALADQPPGREAPAEYQKTLQRGDPRDEEDQRRHQERQLLERERAEMAGYGEGRAPGQAVPPAPSGTGTSASA